MLHEDVPLPSKLVPEMPADVDELVATMTRREPQERPADADEALALLRNASTSSPTPSSPCAAEAGPAQSAPRRS